MNHVLLATVFGATLGLSQASVAGPMPDVEGECRSISEADLSGCRCRGLYFQSKFGPEEGIAALHLVDRSYVSEPRINAAALYERFGANTLDRVAQRILEARDEVLAYCPFSAHAPD